MVIFLKDYIEIVVLKSQYFDLVSCQIGLPLLNFSSTIVNYCLLMPKTLASFEQAPVVRKMTLHMDNTYLTKIIDFLVYKFKPVLIALLRRLQR